MIVARLRKATRLSSPKSYVAIAEGGCANPMAVGRAVVCEVRRGGALRFKGSQKMRLAEMMFEA